LASIVDRSGPLPAMPGADGAELEAGRIYVAVPDRHLLVRDHRVILIWPVCF
jgi:two-component system, chemotaxis family, protein-glutamate methylesterase/glutaminase